MNESVFVKTNVFCVYDCPTRAYAPKRWIVKPFPDAPRQRAAIETLTGELRVNPFLAGLLVQRGCFSFEEARTFFRPEISHLHDPFRMKDMDKASWSDSRERSVSRTKKSLVYGDYDVDGTTSVALMYGFLEQYFIPTSRLLHS